MAFSQPLLQAYYDAIVKMNPPSVMNFTPYLRRIDGEQMALAKLSNYCPEIFGAGSTFPWSNQIMVAGGLINLAADPLLTIAEGNDIDIFVMSDDCGSSCGDIKATIHHWMGDSGVRQKINIVESPQKCVADELATFRCSYTRCAYYDGHVVALPDCIATIRDRVVLPNGLRCTWGTFEKARKRGYAIVGQDLFHLEPTDVSRHDGVGDLQVASGLVNSNIRVVIFDGCVVPLEVICVE